MTAVDPPYCADKWDLNNFPRNAGDIICAVTWDNNKNACHGDSGGPLACQENDGKWHLRGVLSHAQRECKVWTVFTKVARYENWINQIMSG